MVSIQKVDNAIRFTFENSSFYLYNDGTVNVPLNALTLVLDEADMANFVKASSNDNLFSIPMSELSQFADKAALQSWFEENAYGGTGGGGTVDPALDSGSTNAVANSAITTVILDDEYVTAQALTELKLNKLDASAYTRVVVDQSINTASTHAISNAAVGNALNTKGESLMMDSSPTALNHMDIRLRRGTTTLSTAKVDLGDHLVYGGSGGSTTLSVSGLVASTSITSLVTISQADYDALVQAGTVDPSVLYIISNALNP